MHLQPEHLEWGRAFARRREIARRAHWEKEAQRASGVSYGTVPPFFPMTDEQLEREALQWAEIRAKQVAQDEERFAAEVRAETRKPIDPTPELERLAADLRAHVEQGRAA